MSQLKTFWVILEDKITPSDFYFIYNKTTFFHRQNKGNESDFLMTKRGALECLKFAKVIYHNYKTYLKVK